MPKCEKFPPRFAGFHAKSREGGQAILESVLAMMALLLILLGLLQIFHLAVARLVTNYAAYRSLRSYIVGFDDYLVERSARTAAIGASGKIIYPDNLASNSPRVLFAAEEFMIPEYLSGDRWLDYEYWSGRNEYSSSYYHPSTTPPSTRLGYSIEAAGSSIVTESVYFSDYPYIILDMADRNRVWLMLGPSTDIRAKASLLNHASDYLLEN